MPNSLPRPLGEFQDKFTSLEELAQTVYIDADREQFKLEVRKSKHVNEPDSDHFQVHYFVKRGDHYVDNDDATRLPEAYGRSVDIALQDALEALARIYPRAKRSRSVTIAPKGTKNA